uniref:CSP2 n=1 Tax=Hycleus phaleratus TaxID=1248972 RepID=A0A2U9NKV5_9CUCU|nr:CSP2 [Hycleus phaleratus]
MNNWLIPQLLSIILLLININENSAKVEQQYTAKYDNIDVDRILHSKRLLLAYVNCLLDKGPCSPEGRELKKYVPDALATDCVKCTEIQKKQAGKVFSFLLQNYRNEWNMLLDKYDPEGNFRTKYAIDDDYDYSDLDSAK